MNRLLPLAAALLSVPAIGMSQTERDLDSHVHGSATLNVAIDDTAVILELGTPWNNLTGFEHAPSTDAELAAVDAAFDLLYQPDQMFTLEGGDCRAEEVNIESGLSGSAHGDEHHGGDDHDEEHASMEHDEDAHHDDDHDEEHASMEHDEHGDGHGSHEEGGESHSAALVTYTYTCGDTASVSAVDVGIFGLWEGFNDLDVQLIGPGGQAAVELDPDQTLLDISQVQ